LAGAVAVMVVADVTVGLAPVPPMVTVAPATK